MYSIDGMSASVPGIHAIGGFENCQCECIVGDSDGIGRVLSGNPS